MKDRRRQQVESALSQFIGEAHSQSNVVRSLIKKGSLRLKYVGPRSLNLELVLAKAVRTEDQIPDGNPLLFVIKAACHALAAAARPGAAVTQLSVQLQVMQSPGKGRIWAEALMLTEGACQLQCSVDIIDSMNRRIATATCDVEIK